MQKHNRPHHKRIKFVNPFTSKRHKGMLHALNALTYKMPTKYSLATDAIKLEQEKI